jgi:hypothetical protein
VLLFNMKRETVIQIVSDDVVIDEVKYPVGSFAKVSDVFAFRQIKKGRAKNVFEKERGDKKRRKKRKKERRIKNRKVRYAKLK